jgi:Tfp pilus assembly protein PilN
MLSKLKQIIHQIQQASGIEIILLANEDIIINAVQLKLENNKIIKEQEVHALSSYHALAQKIPVNIPAALTVTGKGVLHKKIPLEELSANPFENILPNANHNEFYMELIKFEKFASIYIIRKELLDKIIFDLNKLKYKILSVSLGAADINYLIPFISFEEHAVIKSDTYEVSFNNKNQVIDIGILPVIKEDNYSKKIEYRIADQYVFSPAVISFGAAMGLLANGTDIHSNIENSAIKKEREDYTYYKYYKAALWGALTGIFVVLLINFFIYTYYFNKNQEETISQVLTNEQKKNTEHLQEEIDRKDKFLQQYGWTGSSKLSFYADRIAGLVPESVVLTDLSIYPLHTNFLSENSLITFAKDTIDITGTCSDPTELNKFENNLKNIDDFKNVKINNYVFKKETQQGIFLMEISNQ